MRRAFLVALAAALVLAGCAAKGEDPFAYAKKPLYTGHFDLAPLADGKLDGQEFRVEDGSIARVNVQIWVNATLGGAQVEVTDPSGRTMISTTSTTEMAFPLNLGVWRVTVKGLPDSEGQLDGHVGVLVTRR